MKCTQAICIFIVQVLVQIAELPFFCLAVRMLNERQIQQAIESIPDKQRLTMLEIDGQKIWVKRPEQIQGWRGLYKKLVTPAFRNEIEILRFLNRKNAPVTKILASNDDYLVLEDAGITVQVWLSDPKQTTTEKQAMMYQVGFALADLHQQNLAHGRPALRDICWDGKQLRFIDFEQCRSTEATLWQKKRDLLIFIHGLFLYVSSIDGAIDQAIRGYAEGSGSEILQSTAKTAYRLRWLLPILKLLQPIGGRDLRTAIPLLEFLIQKNHSDD